MITARLLDRVLPRQRRSRTGKETQMKSLFVQYDKTPWIEPIPGFRYKPIIIDKLGGSLVKLDKGVVTQPHAHADEQLDFILKGRIEIHLKDSKGERIEIVTAGMAFALDPHVLHGVKALDDSELIEAWTPADRHTKVALLVREGE
jgi:quercetin dioxygenase-like cupin family protein